MREAATTAGDGKPDRAKCAALVKAAAVLVSLGNSVGWPVGADELVLPQALERDQSAVVAYRFGTPTTGHGFLEIEWSDVTGRLVEQRRIPLELADASEVDFSLDIRRAVTTKNRLIAHLSLDGQDQSGSKVHHERDEATPFIASPPDHAWSDYQIVMWQGQTPAGYAALKQLGVTAGMVEADHRNESGTYMPDQLERLVDADLHCYLENIATDFYSPYHKWSGDRPVNWRFLEAKQRYRDNPLDRSAFVREPSLSDREWLKKIRNRLVRNVRALHPYRPLYFSLGDETGVGDLSAFWDFDFSGPSLAAMRDWLKDGYQSLAALNRQWGADFGRWDEVTPMTTGEAMSRSDQNYSAWADFKEWMDVAFARAVRDGTEAVHAADPRAISAIEGAQIPGWGGYDYSRLAGSVDAMEPYDYGDNVEIVRSFNPQMIMLTTSFKGGPQEVHRVWRELLRGTRGLILWDEKNEFVDENGTLGERGREALSYFPEIRGGLGALLINSRRHVDPIGILYSPASMRMQWLLDRKATGEDWTRRNASSEYQDDAIRTATRKFAHLLEHMGLQHRFVSSEEIRRGELRNGDYRALMLPHAIALARGEAKEISDFVEHGGLVIADGEPGIFDEHGRKMANPLLSEVFAGPATRSARSFAFGKGKAIYLTLPNGGHRQSTERMTEVLGAAGVKPAFALFQTDGRPASDIETHIFTNGEARIVALQRDFVPPASPSSHETVVLALPHPFSVYDLRAHRTLGNTGRLEFELGSVEPVLFALSEKPVAPPSISGPHGGRLGTNAEFLIRSGSPAALDVVHLDVIDPEGRTVAHYSGNVLLAKPETGKLLPLAFSDQPGLWRLRARDLLSGETATAELQVEP